jgi:uncharacterized protein (TIGR02118 family)
MVISSLSTDPSAPAPPALFLDIGQDGRLDESGSAPAVATGVHEDPRAHRAGTALLATSGDGAAQAVGQVCPRWPDLIIRTLSRRKAERRQESVYKVMLSVRRKDGLTREQFRRRYEEGHAPLARKVLPQLRRYVRNYVTDSPGWEADFDVITEFWFDSERDHQAVRAFYASADGQVLVRDEAEFMDRSSMRSVAVNEDEDGDVTLT